MMHPSSAGAGMGFVNFIGSIGALSFPAIFGYLLDVTQSFVYLFTFIAGMALLAFTCVLVWRPA
jgi:nitrate/nitrite transporter NarK